MNIKIILYLILLCSPSFFCQTGITPEQSLALLKAGNDRFVSGNMSKKDFSAEIQATKHGQNPYAIIVTCSDSRVPPEIIFDESIGKLFVIRLAGNVLDSAAVGSIEYAVKYLKSSYLLILGHTHCGAVHAAVSGGSYSPSIMHIAKLIAPAYEKVKEAGVDEAEIEEECIKENVLFQASLVSEMSEIISEHRRNGSLNIGEAIYDIESGMVHFLE